MVLPELMLIPITAPLADEIAHMDRADYAGMTLILGESATRIRELVLDNLNWLATAPHDQTFTGFLAAERESGIVVGACSYVGLPSPEGEIEIAYGTLPLHEGRGVATAMAAALVERARLSARVRIVTANTLREGNASVRILRKLGFRFAGETEDRDEGTVWHWRLDLAGRASH
jgi:RimJ/RimL family protein N-acetyltransferase